MKVIKKSTMPDGTKIQIEDWKKDYSSCQTLSIAAYPVAKADSKYQMIKKGKNFRLGIERFKSDEEATRAFEALVNGEICLLDLSKHFNRGLEDEYYYTGCEALEVYKR